LVKGRIERENKAAVCTRKIEPCCLKAKSRLAPLFTIVYQGFRSRHNASQVNLLPLLKISSDREL
jgi:hypothetical protein